MESAPSPTSPVATVAATMSLLSPDTPGPRTVKRQHPKESPWSLVLQVFPSFLVAGLGMVAAGLVLNRVQFWPAFTEVGVTIMVPALLGLKGNLEMTLASRLSTASNLGRLDWTMDGWSMILGNLVLVQCQGIVIGFLASIVGMLMAWVPQPEQFNLDHALLLCSSAMVTASIASLVLGLVMVAVILLARRLRCDPDNVATPIAASLGDVTTLGLLALISNLLYEHMMEGRQTSLIIILLYLLLLPLLLYLSYKNEHTSLVLCTGWTPVLLAMLISSAGGKILDWAVGQFRGLAVFSPVMNGAGGNLAAIQASRMTTYLNKATNSLFGVFPAEDDVVCVLPCSAFCGGLASPCAAGPGSYHATMARILLSLTVPGHIIFVAAICSLKSLGFPTVLFFTFYLVAALGQVAVLLYLSHLLVYLMWSRGTDPDNAAIPYLTAIGDLLGTSFLAFSFLVLEAAEDSFLVSLELLEMENVTSATY